ncbi:MAG: tRNA (N6-threonylcarbamoyladenosine(37)-N6)-methyltransferase TrmO [Chloroflexi bacterium]|nr:tRNA (N6-threonylcarbamoyladenosine(37)-N6)-methyltransferase TrmO [Chloroflexota bacterium]
MIQLNPIGVVRNAILQAHRDTRWETVESEIRIDAEWRAALDGLKEFSHIWVIAYMHQMPPPSSVHIHPMHDPHAPLVGIFATRSPQRPNGLGLCAAELIGVGDGVLHVRRLDALDGTPVLDIKPYVPGRDALTNARVSAWFRQSNA